MCHPLFRRVKRGFVQVSFNLYCTIIVICRISGHIVALYCAILRYLQSNGKPNNEMYYIN